MVLKSIGCGYSMRNDGVVSHTSDIIMMFESHLKQLDLLEFELKMFMSISPELLNTYDDRCAPLPPGLKMNQIRTL